MEGGFGAKCVLDHGAVEHLANGRLESDDVNPGVWVLVRRERRHLIAVLVADRKSVV